MKLDKVKIILAVLLLLLVVTIVVLIKQNPKTQSLPQTSLLDKISELQGELSNMSNKYQKLERTFNKLTSSKTTPDTTIKSKQTQFEYLPIISISHNNNNKTWIKYKSTTGIDSVLYSDVLSPYSIYTDKNKLYVTSSKVSLSIYGGTRYSNFALKDTNKIPPLTTLGIISFPKGIVLIPYFNKPLTSLKSYECGLFLVKKF